MPVDLDVLQKCEWRIVFCHYRADKIISNKKILAYRLSVSFSKQLPLEFFSSPSDCFFIINL